MNWELAIHESHSRLARGDARAAEEALRPLWNVSSQKPARALMLMGIIMRAQGRLGEAESLLLQSIAQDPRDYQAHHNLGNLYLNAQRFMEAERAYRETVRLAVGLDTAMFGLARSLNGLARHAEAESLLRELLIKSRSADNLRAYAHALGGQGRHGEALAIVDEMLVANPADSGARFDRAVALRRLKRRDEAIAELQTLISQGRSTASVMLAMAMLYTELGDVAAAEEWLSRGVAVHPAHAGLLKEIAHMGWMRGLSLEQACAPLAAALRNRPADIDLASAYADFHSRAGRHEVAERALRSAIAAGAAPGRLLAGIAGLLDEQSKSQGAVDTAEQAFALDPTPETRSTLVHALLRSNDPDRAMPHISAGLAQAPHDQIWLTYLATAERLRKNPAFKRLYDMERFVRGVDLRPPARSGDVLAFNALLAERLDRLHVLEQHPLGQTLRNGTQTPRDLTEVEDDVIQAFLASVRAAVSAFAISLPHDPTHPFLNRNPKGVEFSGSWSVRLKPGGAHFNHVHPMGWISSAYYVRLPKREPDDPPHAGWIKFGEPRLPIPGCTPLKWVEPKVGRLVLFPSYMWHGTEPFFRDDRLTCAFDFVPT